MKYKSICCLFTLILLVVFPLGFDCNTYADELNYSATRIEAMDMDDISRVTGGGFTSQTKNARFGFKHSALWQPDVHQYAEYWFKGFQDWSGYDAAVITLYSNKASNKSVYFRYMSEWNYNSKTLKINWQGWTSIIIPFNDSNRDKVSCIRFGASNASDGIYGQELTIASVRLIKNGEYNFYDSAFGYEVHDTTKAVLGQSMAVYEGCDYALVNGVRQSIGNSGERAVKKDGTMMIPLEFVKSIGWDSVKIYTTETTIDDKIYVSFEEAAQNRGLTTVFSDGLAVATKEGAEIFDGINKQNPYAACATHMICSESGTVAEATADDYSRIKEYIKQELLYNNETDVHQAKSQLEFIRKNADNPFSDLKFETAVDVAEAYLRIEHLALAYASSNNELSGDTNVSTTIKQALDYMYNNHYGKRQLDGLGTIYEGDMNSEYVNVYIPYHIANILILMGEDISHDEQMRYLSPCIESGMVFADNQNIAPTSALAMIGVGAVAEIADLICYGRDKITERLLYADTERSQNKEPFLVNDNEIHTPLRERRMEELPAYVRGNMSAYNGQGIMSDGSYISGGAHGENASSGLNLLDIASVSAALSDTPFAPDTATGMQLFEILKKGYYPFVYNGMAIRIATGNANDGLSEKGVSVLAAMLDSLNVIPKGSYDELCSMIKVIARQYEQSELSELNPRQEELLNTITGAEFEADASAVNNIYSRMDKSVHRTKAFTAGISMSSDRIFDYNSTSCKNMYGWYMGHGMTTIYIDGDRRNFNDEYWSDVNPYKLPGTTVTLAERIPVSVKNGEEYQKGSAFTGGVSSGTYGVSSMTIQPYIISNPIGTGIFGSTVAEGLAPNTNINLSAKKSWFMFDNEVVALGSGITSSDEEKVITTVDNRYGDVLVAEGNKWMHLSGNGECGYYFPNMTEVMNEKTRNGLYELWIDHGVKPNNASYSYVMLPGMTAEQTKAYASAPKVKVLANNHMVQAVDYNKGETCGYVFYQPQSFNGITVSAPIMIMVNHTENVLYVSDPTHSLEQANITIQGIFKATAPELDSYKHANGTTMLSVNFSDSYGKTIAIELSK